MTEIKLLPCPFCGATASAYSYAPGAKSVTCDRCFVTYGPVASGKVVAAWNTRAAHAAQAAEIERLREALETIAEEHDAGRHDGLPEPCPAHDADTMWLLARTALTGGASHE